MITFVTIISTKNICHMYHTFIKIVLAIGTLMLVASCSHDEPGSPFKPLEERRVLVLNYDGEIYDQHGEMVMQLPNCTYAAEIISDGDDYFVSGVQSKDRVGYWKNGKWNTLHVDFIDDVDHWTFGMGKWDYYIFLLDLPSVLKNSGIFPLENCHDFIPADHGLSVSEGKCYVVGSGFEDGDTDEDSYYKPILYTNYKKEYLPMPQDVATGECHAIYSYDRDHTIIGGFIGRMPAVWVDKQYHIYETSKPLSFDDHTPYGRIDAITLCDGHIYGAGWERDESNHLVATVWKDGIPVNYCSGETGVASSQAIEIYTYDKDLYVLTSEYNSELDYDITYLWLNGEIIMSYSGISATGFTVL